MFSSTVRVKSRQKSSVYNVNVCIKSCKKFKVHYSSELKLNNEVAILSPCFCLLLVWVFLLRFNFISVSQWKLENKVAISSPWFCLLLIWFFKPKFNFLSENSYNEITNVLKYTNWFFPKIVHRGCVKFRSKCYYELPKNFSRS